MKGGFQTAIAPEAADTIFHRGSRTSSEADAPWFQELVEASLGPSTASFITRPPSSRVILARETREISRRHRESSGDNDQD